LAVSAQAQISALKHWPSDEVKSSASARAPIKARPGEENGTLIKNGKGYKLKVGDVFNMPPLIPHQSLPDPGGFT
jgi:hypothetical protein